MLKMRSSPLLGVVVLLALMLDAETLILKHEAADITTKSFKVMSWKMGNSYCRKGEASPNCDSYINTAVDKLIALGGNYEIICLQEVPKYYKS